MATEHSRGASRTPQTITLTPRRFHALDRIARSNGAALMPMTFEEMGHSWGRFNAMVGGVVKDVFDPQGWCDEVHIIEIAESIDVKALWKCKRPEMDWSMIPSSRIYEFILWHELGHKLHNFCQIDVWTKSIGNHDGRVLLLRNVTLINEVLADRFAWQSLFPKQELPKAAHCDATHIDGIFKKLEESGLKVSNYQPKPLPADPGKYIPSRLIKNQKLSMYRNWLPA